MYNTDWDKEAIKDLYIKIEKAEPYSIINPVYERDIIFVGSYIAKYPEKADKILDKFFGKEKV